MTSQSNSINPYASLRGITRKVFKSGLFKILQTFNLTKAEAIPLNRTAKIYLLLKLNLTLFLNDFPIK